MGRSIMWVTIRSPFDQNKTIGIATSHLESEFGDSISEQNLKMIQYAEADDILGIVGSQTMLKDKPTTVIISMDKDLVSVPGYIYNPNKDTSIQEVSILDATVAFFHQALMGDATDNYKGCPSVGEAKASKIIEGVYKEIIGDDVDNFNYHDFVELAWSTIIDTYKKQGLTRADALKQARLAKILWFNDYDKDKKKIKPWSIKHFTDNPTFNKILKKEKLI